MKGKGQFPGGPVVKMLLLPMYGAWVQSLVRELRSYIPHGGKKKKKAEAGERKEGKEKQEENRKGEVSDY